MYNISINKQYQQTTGFILKLVNISHLLLIGVTLAEVLFEIVRLFVVLKWIKVCVSWVNSLFKITRTSRLSTWSF